MHAPLLRRDSRLREVVLQMLDAPKHHDTLPLRSAPAKRFLWLVRRVQIRIERRLAPRLPSSAGGIRGGARRFRRESHWGRRRRRRRV